MVAALIRAGDQAPQLIVSKDAVVQADRDQLLCQCLHGARYSGVFQEDRPEKYQKLPLFGS